MSCEIINVSVATHRTVLPHLQSCLKVQHNSHHELQYGRLLYVHRQQIACMTFEHGNMLINRTHKFMDKCGFPKCSTVGSVAHSVCFIMYRNPSRQKLWQLYLHFFPSSDYLLLVIRLGNMCLINKIYNKHSAAQ